MNNTPIECPKCHHKFAISEAIQHEHDEAILNQGIEQGKSQALNEIQPSLAAKNAVIAASPNRELGLLKEVEQLRVAQSSMEKQLRDAFSLDKIEPVKTGENGADVAQHVRTAQGRDCGIVLHETKRTIKWSGWVDFDYSQACGPVVPLPGQFCGSHWQQMSYPAQIVVYLHYQPIN
jgi:hypothetical protein